MIKHFILNKKILTCAILAALLFVGIIALTQELDTTQTGAKEEKKEEKKEAEEKAEAEKSPVVRVPEKPMRWFRSNVGGMALEEIGTRFVALRYEYALAIDYSPYHDIPDLITPYFKSDYTSEIRTLYRKNEIIRTQWIFRDKNGTSRLNAVFIERKKEEEKPKETPASTQTAEKKEQVTEKKEQGAESREQEEENKEQGAEKKEQGEESKEQGSENKEQREESGEQIESKGIQTVEEKPVVKKPAPIQNSPLTGFIETFDEKAFLTSETRFYEDGSKDKIEYTAKDNLIISTTVFLWDKEKKDVTASYTDHYRYNRSLSLRGVEREFLKDMKPEDEPWLITFPRRLMDAVNDPFFTSQRENIVPEFFGDVFVKKDSKIVYESDDRGRIISQTFYDEDEKVVWIIKNIWSNDRITSTIKTEGDNEFTARFEYNANGDKIVERNYKNGVLERVVSTTGKTDVEELYYNNILVLKAVWEDGRKIQEERVR